MVIISSAELRNNMKKYLDIAKNEKVVIQRVNEEGGCNPEAMRYFGVAGKTDASDEAEVDNPFAALKDMFK